MRPLFIMLLLMGSASAQFVAPIAPPISPPELDETSGMPKNGGPAKKDLMDYLANTPANCARPAPECTLASKTTHMWSFYGTFPNDPADYVIAFLSLETGGSGETMMAVVMKNVLPKNHYVLVGTKDVYGVNPRELEFEADRTITWVGTVARPDDPYCCPTGARYFHMVVEDRLLFYEDGARHSGLSDPK